MNRLLLFEDDREQGDDFRIGDRRLQHITAVLKASPGSRLRAGLWQGPLGSAEVIAINENSASLRFTAESEPPPKLPLVLLLALPRPKAARRIIRAVAELGVEQLILVHSQRVDKSYWQSPLLSEERIHGYLIEAMEQSGDTCPPEVIMRHRFRPFVEDHLPAMCANRSAWLAHPREAAPCPAACNTPGLLAVGPDGGFNDFELELLQKAGLQRVQIGPRVQRVETAVPALISRLYDLSTHA